MNLVARHTETEILFDGIDISNSIRNYFLSMTYSDSAEDESDDLEIRIADRENLWTEAWLSQAVDAAASRKSSSGSAGMYTVTPKIGLNIRAGPGTNHKKLGALPCGTELSVSAVSGGWAEITYNGGIAYVSANFLKHSDSETAYSVGTGLEIQAAIIRRNWFGSGTDARLDCGSFELDSIDIEGPPNTITFHAAALSASSSIRDTVRSQSWEKYCLSGIAEEIARRNRMVCMFQSDFNPEYERKEQSRESDIAFLKRLCKDAGISLKISNHNLVLFDERAYESMEPVLSIRCGDGSYTGYRLHVGTAGTAYQSCRVSYNDPQTGKRISAVEKIPEYDEEHENNRQLEIYAKVKDEAEAKVLAGKRLRLANKYARSASFELIGNPAIISGVTVMLENWGTFSGKYFVYQVTHEVGSGGYTTNAEMRRVLEGY